MINLTKEELQAFKNAGYHIQVSYTTTTCMLADVNPTSLVNCQDTSDVEFDNDEVQNADFDDDSENYSIWQEDTNHDHGWTCIADDLDFDGLIKTIHELMINLPNNK